jgi:hypothetical protein
MPVWEYKVISSGKGGFASPALLESFLNQLGKEEWEIIHFQSPPDNPLAFSGVARRSTQRDWTLEDAAASAARAEADKLRAEFEAKFKGTASSAPADEKSEASAESVGEFRRLRDTESDLDPDAPDENAGADDWEKIGSEEELPTFFEAIRPHLRRNQRGPGLSAGLDFLAKKWGLGEEDLMGALKECGFAIPEDEDAPPVYLEYDGDLFWVNRNRRGELWINTKEKPRPAFRISAGKAVASAETGGEESANRAEPAPHAGDGGRERQRGKHERERERGEPGESLPAGPVLLEKITPQMRRNRDGTGLSGSLGFLSRALRCSEADLAAAFAALGLSAPAEGEAKPAPVEIGDKVWWLDRDQRGGTWINRREKAAMEPPKESENAQTDSAPAHADSTPAASGEPSVLGALRLLLKETKTGSFSAESGRLAEQLNKPVGDLLSALTDAGLKIPEKSREKPVFIEFNGEIFWLNRNSKDELWLNAKPSKFSRGENGAPRGRTRGRGRRGPVSQDESAPAESAQSSDQASAHVAAPDAPAEAGSNPEATSEPAP